MELHASRSPGKNLLAASAVWGLGTLILILSMAFSISQGAARIPVDEVFSSLFRFDETSRYHLIVRDLRMPRVLASALVGMAFSVSGAIMQGVTRNPLADTGLMGLNAGAGFALSLTFALFPKTSYMHVVISSFLGAAVGAVLVFGIASLRKGGLSPMRMVLAGAAVAAMLSAVSQAVALYFNVAQDIMFWTAGGVSGSTWDQLSLLAPWVIGAMLAAILLSRPISLLNLGEDVARGLGINTMLIKGLCSLVVLVLAGSSVAVVGAVGFVGLIIPHLARFLVGADYRYIIPTSAILGGLLMVWADLGARMLNPPFETPIGVLTALIGVPFFLYLAKKDRRG